MNDNTRAKFSKFMKYLEKNSEMNHALENAYAWFISKILFCYEICIIAQGNTRECHIKADNN